jgi:hypothetical protein
VGALETMRTRQAALLLHGMEPMEQQKVLAKLDVAESSRLIPLLAELAELGLPPARAQEVHRLVMGTVPERTADVGSQTPLERAGRLSAEEVVLALESCAPATAAQLLRASEWAWKASVLGRMSEAQRVEMLERMRKDSLPLAPAALRALCERLCTQAVQSRARGRFARELLPSSFEGLRAETGRFGKSAWPAESGGIGARLRRLIRWTR